MPKITIIESPYAGDLVLNVQYARRALRDAIDRGETPFAGHLLYTQALNDQVPEERTAGMYLAEQLITILAAGIHAGTGTHIVCAVYDDLGISPGMKRGIEHAANVGAKVEFRKIADWPETKCLIPKNVIPITAEAVIGKSG